MLQQEKETLKSVGELAKEHCNLIRKHWNIVVNDEDVPPHVASFKKIGFLEPILKALKAKGIVQLTPIQVQGLPVILSGRDMIGVASTGSGKTLVFVLPLVMLACQAESMMPNEGLIGLIIYPSRELAKQIYEVVEGFLTPMREVGYPAISSLLCIGGVGVKSQLEIVNKGVHIVVATPGRLTEILKLKRMNLDHSKYLTLDEADRLVGFEDNIREVFDHFKGQHQTLLCSTTMPTQILNFTKGSLLKPVTINTGIAGTANLSVRQQVVLVQEEAKNVYLLECLQKTAPPVLIYYVDDIMYFLLIKGVEVVGIHAEMDQKEREYVISSFKARKKDVLIATDVVSKGLYFPDVDHVINYDMLSHVEDYV